MSRPQLLFAPPAGVPTISASNAVVVAEPAEFNPLVRELLGPSEGVSAEPVRVRLLPVAPLVITRLIAEQARCRLAALKHCF